MTRQGEAGTRNRPTKLVVDAEWPGRDWAVAIVEGLSDGVALIQAGRIVYANPALAQALGCSVGELHEEPVENILLEAGEERIVSWLGGESPDEVNQWEGRLVRSDGASVPAQISSGPLRYRKRRAVLAVFKVLSGAH